MKNRYLLIALALIILVNGSILFGVAGNRRGNAEATLILTERELNHRTTYQEEENSGVSLSLDWNKYSGERPWFNAQKLTDLGFDVEAIKQNNQSRDSYRRLLPKKGYVVLEYAGTAWRDYQVDKENEIDKLLRKTPADKEEAQNFAAKVARIKEDLLSASRLFAINVGPEPDALRQRYLDRSRFAIVAAELRAGYWNNKKQEVRGSIGRLLIDRLHVPRSLLGSLADLSPTERPTSYDASPEVRNWQPRYAVTVNWGSRFEPWVEEVALISAGEKE